MQLPARGPAVRELGLPLPPDRMPAWQRLRPLKRWRYVGVFGPELQLCVGEARIGPVPVRWWAIAEKGQPLLEGRRRIEVAPGRVHVRDGDVAIEVEIDERDPVEIATAYGRSFAWTAKQADVPARGSVRIAHRAFEIDARAVVDVSAGYHPRHTQWKWSAGVGTLVDGRSVGWNLVAGVHDSPENSERTIWVNGAPAEVGPVEFGGLETIEFGSGERLQFGAWCERRDRTSAIIMRSYYRQPFGEFSGSLPVAGQLAEGYGVMEEHDVYW